MMSATVVYGRTGNAFVALLVWVKTFEQPYASPLLYSELRKCHNDLETVELPEHSEKDAKPSW